MPYETLTEAFARQTAIYLLETEAVKLRPEKPFTWASGWQSPIYCDNRVTLSFPVARKFIADKMAELVTAHFGMPKPLVIAGVATAGIPQGALIADRLGCPFVYVRSAPKGHGMENLIEGRLPVGAKVVVVEDLISTGGSSLKAVQALKDAGADVLGMVATFTYGFDIATDNFKMAGVPLFTLSDYDVLVKVASQSGYIPASALDLLASWRAAPDVWGK